MKKILIFAAFAFITLNSCKKEGVTESKQAGIIEGESKVAQDINHNTFPGPVVQMGSGMARSWITLGHKGVPLVIGVEMTDEVLSGLPKTNFSVVVPMPDKAKETTPFEHMYITWAANGHPLPGTFIGPHFDVRFYMISNEKRVAILPPPAPEFNKLPPSGYMPASYFPDAGGAPVGLNWTNKTFPDPVTNALILGTYNGEFIFVAPIMILDVLKSGQSISLPYAQPQYFAKHTWYPTTYNIYTDKATHKHYVALSDFVWR